MPDKTGRLTRTKDKRAELTSETRPRGRIVVKRDRLDRRRHNVDGTGNARNENSEGMHKVRGKAHNLLSN